MIIGDEVKKKISDTPDGVVLTISDFNVDMQYQGALVKALNRLARQGTLQRLSKGKYYKPRVDKELLSKYHKGLICLSSGVDGEVYRAIIKNNKGISYT